MDTYRTITNCRVCGSADLNEYLDLGNVPLANALISSKDSEFLVYPLKVLLCNNCFLSQLSVVVDPDRLYKNYFYHSSVSDSFKNHCLQLAQEIKEYFDDTPIGVIDIACNDGCLLQQFRRAGYSTIGVEPCKNLVDECTDKQIGVINNYWSKESAERCPAMDVVTATNVLAHVDNVVEFVENVKLVLRRYRNGFCVVEVPYMKNLIDNNQFDTIYHEHLSYFLFRPLKQLFESCGFTVFHVKEVPIHGGSLRVYATPYTREVQPSVQEFLDSESRFYNLKGYQEFNDRIKKVTNDFINTLIEFRVAGKQVVGYGASAKAVMMINQCELTSSDIECVVDDTLDKQGKFIPGSGIPIVGRDYFSSNQPDYIALMSWNFSDELMEKTKFHQDRGGKYIVAIPEIRII